jgi:hypothetical protein
MLDTPCSEVAWRVQATHSIRQFPLHSPSRASPCAITFQLDSSKSSLHVYTRECNLVRRSGFIASNRPEICNLMPKAVVSRFMESLLVTKKHYTSRFSRRLFAVLRKSEYWASSSLSEWNNSAPNGRIFIKFDMWVFFWKSVEKIQVSLKSDKNNEHFTRRPIHIFKSISVSSS